jgi:hypothetical protein
MSATNTSDHDEYPDLAEDPDLAFRQLERKFRREMTEALKNLDENESGNLHYLSYINRTVAAAKTLGIEAFKEWEIPSHQRGSLWDEYQEFNTAVEHYVVQLQIMGSRRVRGYSVQLDAATKSKIRHYLEKIREIVDRLEVPLPKKEALTAKITALSDEVDRDRTRFDAYAGLALEVAATGGEIAQKLNPLRRFLDSIAGLLGYAKQAEDARPTLPAPHERKRLTPPRKERLPPSQPRLPDLDDDIPF